MIAVNTATTACYALPEAIRATGYMLLVADAQPGRGGAGGVSTAALMSLAYVTTRPDTTS